MKIKRTLPVTVGIYQTQYTLVMHRDRTITVTYPFVHWQNSTGTLAFERVSFNGALAEKIKQAFAEQTLFLPGYESATIQDAVLGRL